MAPAETKLTPNGPAYITPITCPNCGGKADLGSALSKRRRRGTGV